MKDYSEIVETWFSRLEKGYAMPPYSKSQLRVLKNVLAEMNIVGTIDTQKINEAPKDKERLEKIIAILRKNPAFISAVFRETMKYSEEGVDIGPELEKSTGESDHKNREILKYFIKAINDTPGDYDDIERFVLGYGQFDFIDTKKLMSGATSFRDFIVSRNDVSFEFLYALFLNLYDVTVTISGSNRGPGEVALALLSPKITFADVGDLKVNSDFVEVKGELRKGSGGGRLKNSNADFGKIFLDSAYLNRLYDELNIPEENRKYKIVGSGRSNDNLVLIAQELESVVPGTGQVFAERIINDVFINAPQDMKDAFIDKVLTIDPAQSFSDMAEIAYMNYVEVLKGKAFSHFLLLNKGMEKAVAFPIENYKSFLNKDYIFTSLSFVDKRGGPAIQLQMR